MFQDTLKKAENGDLQAMLEVAESYYDGDQVEENDDQAFAWAQKAYELAPDNTDACYLYGKYLMDRCITDEQRELSATLLEQAANNGNIHACFKLAMLHLNGWSGMELDPPRAISYLEKGAALDGIGCIVLLGQCCLEGNGVERDIDRGISLLERAADRENPVALRTLAIQYYTGDLVPIDINKAFEYNIRAAEAGESYGALHAARMLLEGDKVPKDIERGLMYLRKAIEIDDNQDALYLLGIYTLQGMYGITPDREEALRLLNKAKNAGSKEAEQLIDDFPEPAPAAPEPPVLSTQGKKKGCYVATAVYGSYQCPEVRVLRRYRDNRLSKSIAGRMFIRIYYRVSPLLIARFGHIACLKRACKRWLDAVVAHLQRQGYPDTPYQDDNR